MTEGNVTRLPPQQQVEAFFNSSATMLLHSVGKCHRFALIICCNPILQPILIPTNTEMIDSLLPHIIVAEVVVLLVVVKSSTELHTSVPTKENLKLRLQYLLCNKLQNCTSGNDDQDIGGGRSFAQQRCCFLRGAIYRFHSLAIKPLIYKFPLTLRCSLSHCSPLLVPSLTTSVSSDTQRYL